VDGPAQSRTAERVGWELHAVPGSSPTVTALPQLAAACGLRRLGRRGRADVPSSPAAILGNLPRQPVRKATATNPAKDATPRTRRPRRARVVRERAGGDRDAARRVSRAPPALRAGKARFMDDQMSDSSGRALLAFAERGAARLWFLDTASARSPRSSRSNGTGRSPLQLGIRPDRAALSPGVVLLRS